MNLRDKGVAVMTLSDLVDSFCLEQGNMREAFITKVLNHAKWVWKDLYRTKLQFPQTQVYTLDKHNAFVLPENCERILNISVVDKMGVLHPLTYNSNINTAKIQCDHSCGCSCKQCNGQNSLCGALDTLKATTTPYTIPNPSGSGCPPLETFTTSWVITNGCGDIQTVTRIPIVQWNIPPMGCAVAESESLWTYENITQTICNVQVDDKGCIKPTEENLSTFNAYLGLYGFSSDDWAGFKFLGQDLAHRQLVEPMFNNYGYWNYNAADTQIVHLFRNESCPICHLDNCIDASHRGEKFGSIILTYQSNGETPNKEILIPEYAYDAIVFGIVYRQAALSMASGSRVGIEERKRLYEAEKDKVMRFLNPLRIDDIIKLQTIKILW